MEPAMRSRLIALDLALAISICSVANADDRLPIPDQAAQKKANELIQAVFGDQTKAATKPDAKLALVNQLLEESSRADTSVAARYAMLKAALDVAPDTSVAMPIIENMARHFRINELSAKAYTIKQMSKFAITPSQRKTLAESSMDLADAYVKKDSFKAASGLAKIAMGRSQEK
jgi:hypothetical protein